VVNRRAAIALDHDELVAYLASTRTITCATNGSGGWPHLAPLWFAIADPPAAAPLELVAWTFERSQKVRNLERDPRATLQAEDGTAYTELRGAVLRCEVVIVRDVDAVRELGLTIAARYQDEELRPGGGTADLDEAARQQVDAQASKRVGLRFREVDRASWDHRKL
jgi:nitroimidazol reductase NimA-like FMN-containing flavoprotein (pyridoxamine 5'-phosphate oxidase superfamily)